MQEKQMAIVKYASHIFPFYKTTPDHVDFTNPAYSPVPREMPTAFLYCEAQYVDNLSGNIEIGGLVRQTKTYPAMDALDNIMLNKAGVVMAIGYESFILELLNQPYDFVPKTAVYDVEL